MALMNVHNGHPSDPSKVSWHCSSISDDQDIGLIHEVHQMLWSGFVEVAALHMADDNDPGPVSFEECRVNYELEDDDMIYVSIFGYDKALWGIHMQNAPDKIKSIMLNPNGRTVIEFVQNAPDKIKSIMLNPNGRTVIEFEQSLWVVLILCKSADD